jgi:signal transduction histidine kinase
VYRIFEVDPASHRVSFAAFLEAIHPEDRPQVEEAYRESLRTRSPFAITHRLLLPGGRVKVVEERCETRHDPEGRPLRSLGTVQDVTEVRALQDKLVRASRLAAMGTLVAGVGHEIGNPLAVAMTNDGAAFADLEDLRRLVAGGEPLDREALARQVEDIQGSVGNTLASVRRIAAIVKDLVLLGRSEASSERVRLRDVVDGALPWLQGSIPPRVTLEVRHQGAPDVLGTAGQLVQVIINLATNGAKAIPAGRNGVVRITLGPGSPGMARIDVSDDGVGMTREVMERIFDPFFTTREVGQGAGLGLRICHAIVTAHGGTLTVETTPGAGSTFHVELPAAGEGA